jgi:hypothetical protein
MTRESRIVCRENHAFIDLETEFSNEGVSSNRYHRVERRNESVCDQLINHTGRIWDWEAANLDRLSRADQSPPRYHCEWD